MTTACDDDEQTRDEHNAACDQWSVGTDSEILCPACGASACLRQASILVLNLSQKSQPLQCPAFYGESGIPSEWLAKLALRDDIGLVADALLGACLSDRYTQVI